MSLENEVTFSFVRSSGPGGQNVNKVNSKAVLRWSILDSKLVPLEALQRLINIAGHHCTSELEIVISSDKFRDQLRNKEECIKKLRSMIERASEPPKTRKKTRPSRSSVRKKHESKRKHSEKKASRKKSFG